MADTSYRDRFLRRRGARWHYYRRVPERFTPVDPRGTIRIALGTDSAEIARLRRDELAAADETFWAAAALSEEAGGRETEPSRPKPGTVGRARQRLLPVFAINRWRS